MGIMSSLKEACASKDPSTIVISQGTYMVGPVKFQGPCKAHSTIDDQGTWKAPKDLDKIKSQDGWIMRGWFAPCKWAKLSYTTPFKVNKLDHEEYTCDEYFVPVQIIFQNIDGLALSGGTFDGQGEIAWKENNCAQTGKCNSLPTNIRFNSVTGAIIQDITSLNSKFFHMILSCKNMTLQDITINVPETSLNTDGIHIGRSSRINITDMLGSGILPKTL
ncbi:hypothetical protein HYC85_011811 [Camellia sinensis]|uniref:Polygalacturonase n=1 Tax=Camellia sinensis TaxID=4442 RepID=A0A7J7HD69_CAMSI|nr:hypothetical protein HYC85_011811 [Camellia sinensis]